MIKTVITSTANHPPPPPKKKQVLVHGELNNMTRLRNALKDKYLLQKNEMQIHTPRNVETLRLKFQASRIARVSLPSLIPTTETKAKLSIPDTTSTLFLGGGGT